MPYASALDLLLNRGADARAVLLSGRRQTVPAEFFYAETNEQEAPGQNLSIA